MLAGGAILCGCAAQPAAGVAPIQPAKSLSLIGSSPSANSTVAGPVEELVLRFSRPVRLSEVIVDGPQGAMPMKITAAGETGHYSLPLAGLEPGSYKVRWKAISQDRAYEGAFSFTVN